jgi:hypothetical protein
MLEPLRILGGLVTILGGIGIFFAGLGVFLWGLQFIARRDKEPQK